MKRGLAKAAGDGKDPGKKPGWKTEDNIDR